MNLFLFCLILVGGSVGHPHFSHGAESAISISELSVGFNDVYKVGEGFPVQFLLSGPVGKSVTPVLKAADPDGNSTLIPLQAVELTGQPQLVRGVARSGRLESPLQVQIFEEGPLTGATPLAQSQLRCSPDGPLTVLKQSSQLWLSLGPQPFLKQGLEAWQTHRGKVLRLVEANDPSAFVWSATALESVDVIVLTGATPLTSEESIVIRDWVSDGGRLLIALGDTVEALQESPLSKWLPEVPTNSVEISKLSSLNELVPRSSSLRTLTTLQGGLLSRTGGAIIANGITEPMAVRYGFGVGQVTMLAVGLDAIPLLNWEPESQGALAMALAGIGSPTGDLSGRSTGESTTAELNPSAVTDLQIQLNHSLDDFPNIKRTSHWQVIGWVMVLMLFVGPIDYWLVTRVLKRPEWTWATTIAWSALFAGYALSAGANSNTSGQLARQINVLDLDPVSQTVSSKSWFGFYNNDLQRTTLQGVPNLKLLGEAFQPDQLETRLGWIDRPTEGFRGMYRTGGIDPSKPAYEFSQNQSEILNLPVQQWSSGTAEFVWSHTSAVSLPITSELNETGSSRLGTGRISHQFDGDLEDWFIVYKNFVYYRRAGVPFSSGLAPGEVFEINTAASSLAKTWLAARIEQANRGYSRPMNDSEMTRLAYDKHSDNPFSIGLTMSFYSILGGESYTTLQNQSLSRLDLSNQVATNKAILIGRLKSPSARLNVGGIELEPENQSTLVRVMLPVNASVRSSDAPPTQDVLDIRR